jgi:tRNA threonylcarbamoyladenosine modification (KEOPS) complex  Pcc1 subunit
MEAEIILECDDEKSAEAIAKAVSPDNPKTTSSLSIKTTREEKNVVTRIRCRRELPTFIATIDDLLFCASTAENVLQTTKQLE